MKRPIRNCLLIGGIVVAALLAAAPQADARCRRCAWGCSGWSCGCGCGGCYSQCGVTCGATCSSCSGCSSCGSCGGSGSQTAPATPAAPAPRYARADHAGQATAASSAPNQQHFSAKQRVIDALGAVVTVNGIGNNRFAPMAITTPACAACRRGSQQPSLPSDKVPISSRITIT